MSNVNDLIQIGLYIQMLGQSLHPMFIGSQVLFMAMTNREKLELPIPFICLVYFSLCFREYLHNSYDQKYGTLPLPYISTKYGQ